MRGPLIVLFERDDFARELYTEALVSQGFRVRAEAQLEEALAAIKKGAQLLVAGIAPGAVAVAEIVAQTRRASNGAGGPTPVLVILSRNASEGSLRALRDGALEALVAPVSAETLALGVLRCLETVTLFERLPELSRHVELFTSAQRLQRAADAPTLARELLDAAAARLPAAGVAVSTAGPVAEIIAARGLDDDDLRELLAAWDPVALERAEPFGAGAAELPPEPPARRGAAAAKRERFEDRVVTFPPGAGPFARAVGQTAKLQPGILALRLGAIEQPRLWIFLFPPPRSRREGRALDGDTARHLGVLAAQASFALQAQARYPDGLYGAIDPTTDLFDERFFERTLQHEARRHEQQGGPGLAVLAIELDGLPAILDLHGALVGDRLLIEAARILVRAVRELDLVARTGPQRFEVMLLGTAREGAERSAGRLRRTLGEHRFLAREGLDLSLAVSIGVAAFPEDGAEAGALRAAAEQRRMG
jgi:diguanylate cyclase (GGDEF)-like protein